MNKTYRLENTLFEFPIGEFNTYEEALEVLKQHMINSKGGETRIIECSSSEKLVGRGIKIGDAVLTIKYSDNELPVVGKKHECKRSAS